MLTAVEVTMDCSDAAALPEFWKLAVGYVEIPPPEPKTVNNCLHLDLVVAGEGLHEEQWCRVTENTFKAAAERMVPQ